MKINYIPYEQLTKDAFILSKRIPRKYDIVIGIPNSGMIPAYVIGFALGVPVYNFDEFDFNNNEDKTVLLIDDSITSGSTLGHAIEYLNGYKNYNTAVIYSDRPKPNVDYYQRIIEAPRVFQWNLFKHGHLATAGLDFDGVLCHDPNIIECDQNPEDYINFLQNAKPLYLPKRKVKAIITNRIEKYRKYCEDWLKRHKVEYEYLVMSPFKTAHERRVTYNELGGNGFYKASRVKEFGCKWFIESDIVQAKQIKSVFNESVFCTDTMQML